MKSILFFLFCALVPYGLTAQSSGWGKADTLSHHPVGPGMFFTELLFPEKPLAVYVFTIDLTNPHNKIESYQSNNKVPDNAGQVLSAQCRANTYEGHRVAMGVNHDFYDIKGGVAIGTNIRNGEMTHNGEWRNGVLMNRSVLTIDSDKRANVIKPLYFMNILFSNGHKLPIEMVNDRIDDLHSTFDSKQVVLYNQYNAKILDEEGVYVKINPIDEWLFNSDPIRAVIKEIKDEPLQTDAENYVIRLAGNSATESFLSNASLGDTIQIEQLIRAVEWGAHTNNITQAFHGYPSIIRRGELHQGEYDNFENSSTWPNGRAYEVANRTMAGISKDGRSLYLVVVDGRRPGWSVGLNCIETALFLVELGAYHVVNFDGGGSSTMVVNNEVKNKPTDAGGERKVMNSLQAISIAPADDIPCFVYFKQPGIRVRKGSSVQLDHFLYNKYNEIIEMNPQSGVCFELSPHLKGVVNSSGIFDSFEESSGYVTAKYENFSDTIFIQVTDENNSIDVISEDDIFYCNPSVIEDAGYITFEVKKDSYLTLSLHNLLGKEIEVISSGFYHTGKHECLFISKQPPGIYFLVLKSKDERRSVKIIIR